MGDKSVNGTSMEPKCMSSVILVRLFLARLVMDSFEAIAPECLLLVNGLENIVAFGFAYGAIPWSGSQGYAKVGAFLYDP